MKNIRGQSLTEYGIVLGIVTTVLIVMSPMIRQVVQGMVKTVADQVGNQRDAEQQKFKPDGTLSEDGFLIDQYSATRMTMTEDRKERLGNITYVYDDIVNSVSNSYSNLGLTPNQ